MSGKQYAIELSGGLLVYAAALVVSLTLLRHGAVHGAAATAVAVAPMLPAAGVCWAILRQLRRIDEFQQRLQLEALSMAFAGTAFLTFGYGFLENVGYPPASMFVVWPIMAVLWVVSMFVCRRRYA